MSHVLVVDDEPAICWGLRELLVEDGHRVSVAGSAEQALGVLAADRPDAVVLDVRLPDADGLTLLGRIHQELGRETPVIVITAFGNLETAVRAVQSGAFDYLTKPFDLDAATAVIRRALLPRSAAPGPGELSAPVNGRLLGASPAMQAVFKRIALVASSDVPVLVTGESGTGKEEVALAIHAHSSRAAGPFVPVCVAALSEPVLESELFGHVRGAFTGADTGRTGLLEQAHRGTVFLDEIGDISLALQVKLLRAIERHEVTPVGDSRSRASDFRVVAATHRSLSDLVVRGLFREDLLYRLKVFEIELPPLQQRGDDVRLLAEHFLGQVSGGPQGGGRGHRWTTAALAELQARQWSGNVRELRNAVEHAAILAREGDILPEHLPPPAHGPIEGALPLPEQIQRDLAAWSRGELAEANPGTAVDLYERLLKLVEPPVLESTLAHSHGNRAEAARLLGIHRSTLREKLRDAGERDAANGNDPPGG